MQPRSTQTALRGILLAAVLLGSPLSAHAMFIHDLSVTGNFSGTGQIELDSASGNSLANVIAFSFTVTATGGGLPIPKTFTLGDIGSLSWTGADTALSLVLRSKLVGQLGLVLKADDNNLVDDVCGAFGVNSGSTYCSTSGSTLVGGSTLTTSPAVPEPGMLGLLGAGLLGLAWRRRAA